MSIPIEVLEAELLSLPQADRSRLVDKLLVSLGHDPAWEETWGIEADRREARLAQDPQQWVDGQQALAQARARLK